MQWIGAVLVLILVVAVFLTTTTGKRWASRLGLALPLPGNAPKQDRDYLLRVCESDRKRVTEMLAEARRHNPDMNEAEAYRKAIRVHLRDEI